MVFTRGFMLALTVFGLRAEETRHWAYEPPVKAAVSGHLVDGILAGVREEKGTVRAEMASPRQWIERAAITLTGLPPTAAQTARIEANPDEKTWGSLLDELLASPAYGERWARHWMDVARYADTFGYNFMKDNRYPYAWTYRDWLIRAFNEDRPWEEFVQLQLAADLMVDRPNHPDLAALGLLTVGPRGRRELMIDDRVDVVTRGFMGTTVSCARCHDHKTDPISMTDYYSFFSILENLSVETRGPVIGEPSDPRAHADFKKKLAALEDKDRRARQAFVKSLREEASLAVYLELGWLAHKQGWDVGKAGAEGFKRGRFRGKAVTKWKEFFRQQLSAAKVVPRLAAWNAKMGDASQRKPACRELAKDWVAAIAAGEGALSRLARHRLCPLSFEVDRVASLYDQKDSLEQRGRTGDMAKLEGQHPGAPPRAMVVKNREKWAPARIYRRGNPAERGEPFARHWLEALGGDVYPEGRNPRMEMARRIGSPSNPLTGRVIVNRVWAWHFGAPLADPGDFGPQQPSPLQQALLDRLTVWFWEQGGSLKKLHKLLLTSETYRLSADGPAANRDRDEANETYWKWNRQRLDFESMRDRILLTSGSLDTSRQGGRSTDLEKPASDRRRSLYAYVDRYALPNLLVNFDLPHPDHHAAKRVETTVPQQALFFLNGRMPLRQARRLVHDPGFVGLGSDDARIRWLYKRVLGRDPTRQEMGFVKGWVADAPSADYAPPMGGAWKVGWSPVEDYPSDSLNRFPVFSGGFWKTGNDLSKAPIPWLSIGRMGGHPSKEHALVLRWTATGSGEIRLSGSIHHTGKGGPPLIYQMVDAKGQVLEEQALPESRSAPVKGRWVHLEKGNFVDVVILAPEGHRMGTFRWNLKVLGRETKTSPAVTLATTAKDMPSPKTEALKPVATGNVWSDLVQMLWASNEFNYLD